MDVEKITQWRMIQGLQAPSITRNVRGMAADTPMSRRTVRHTIVQEIYRKGRWKKEEQACPRVCHLHM
jgi:hypothetical protein